MNLRHLPDVREALEIHRIEDRPKPGFRLIRTDAGTPVEVALVRDGPDRRLGEAEEYARLLALAPVMLRLLDEALTAWTEEFDAPNGTEEHVTVPAADLVDWFAQWRIRARDWLAAPPASV